MCRRETVKNRPLYIPEGEFHFENLLPFKTPEVMIILLPYPLNFVAELTILANSIGLNQ